MNPLEAALCTLYHNTGKALDQQDKAAAAPAPTATPAAASMSGGEVEGPLKKAYDRLAKLITAAPDVHRLVALMPFHDSVPDGQWLYLIETPFSSFPRFVIGETDAANTAPSLLFQSGTDWSAQDHWDHLVSQIR